MTAHRITTNAAPESRVPLIGHDPEFARFLELRKGGGQPLRFARLRHLFGCRP